MARLSDWKTLADDTFRALDTRRVTRLYSIEWPEARERLIEEYRDDIAREPTKPRRVIRTASALIYGLTKRLAPPRRILFAFAFLAGTWGIASLMLRNDIRLSFPLFLAILSSFVLLTFLLAVELIDKLKFRDELELARELQAALVPKQLPAVEGLELAAYNDIANMVGGDFYDFTPLRDGRLAIIFGDASGHGMTAGLVMAVAHASFRTQLDVDPEPDAMFGTLNRILCRTGSSRSFFAGIYLLISPDGSFRVSVAGHPPILQFGSGGSLKRSIGQGAYPLGIKPHFSWKIDEGQLEEGDVLLLHSDGLAEARNAAGESFGYDRVPFVASRLPRRSAHEILYSLLAEFRAFTGEKPVEDDVSVSVIRRKTVVE